MSLTYYVNLSIIILSSINNFFVSIYYLCINIPKLFNNSYIEYQYGMLVAFCTLDAFDVIFSFIMIIIIITYRCSEDNNQTKFYLLFGFSTLLTIISIIIIVLDLISISFKLWNIETLMADFGAMSTTLIIMGFLCIYRDKKEYNFEIKTTKTINDNTNLYDPSTSSVYNGRL